MYKIERNSCYKVTNKITFHPSFKTFYYPYICVDGVTKIVEHVEIQAQLVRFH